MRFSYNWLKEYVPSLPPPKKLAELLTLHSFEVEAMEKSGKDWVLSVDILPNRFPDAANHRGLAGEISALLGKAIKEKKISFKENGQSTDSFLQIRILDKDFCRRYSALIIRGVKIASSPAWLKERLKTLGFEPINNVVDIVNYVTLDSGQPLHAFDFDKIAGSGNKSVFVRPADKEEDFVSLDGQKYNLSPAISVVSDAKGAIAVAGVKGAKRPEISADTKIIMLEAANFHGGKVRMAARFLNLLTDAALRFAPGLDPNLTVKALKEAAFLIQDIAGGEISKGIKDFYPHPDIPKKIMINSKKIAGVLGADISEKDIVRILKSLYFGVEKKKQGSFMITAPTIRRDINIEEDIIEEVGRVYGYDRIKPAHPLGELIAPERNGEIFWQDKVKEFLSGLGYSEINNYSFAGKEELNLFDLGHFGAVIEVQNPTKPEFSFLRPYLSLNMINNAARAIKTYDQTRFFETGGVYRFPQAKFKDTPELEQERLAMIIALRNAKEGEAFFELKGAVAALFDSLGLAGALFDDAPESPKELLTGLRRLMRPARSAQIKFDGDCAGLIGEAHPEILRKMGVKGAVAFLEISLEKICLLAEEEAEYKPVSRFPSLVRDIAVLVPLKTKVDEVFDVIENAGGEFLIDTDIFDIYEGENIPEGRKNLAFHLKFQAFDRTLSDKKASGMLQKIIDALERQEQWEVRK